MNTGLKRVSKDGTRSKGGHSGSMSQESPAKDRVARKDRYDRAEGYGRDDKGSYSKSGICSWVFLACSKN